MTQNKRIFLNVAVTYGRSLIVLICGLFAGRWALMALGAVDLGLYELVGGISGFLMFFNGVLAAAVGRYYAFSIGEASSSNNLLRGLENCQVWFSIAIGMHFVLASVLVVVGWPIGEYAIFHWLDVPAERIGSCITVFRIVCVSCWISMLSVPFQAMYVAKQYIAELTIYQILSVVLRMIGLYYMVVTQGDWFVGYAILLAFCLCIPQIVLSFRAPRLFQECRFTMKGLHDFRRVRELLAFAFWDMFSSGGYIMRTSGVTMMVNKLLGPVYNATQNIANNVASQSDALSISVVNAFAPVITNAYGAGNLAQVRQLTLRTCRLCSVLTLVFLLPLALEISEVLRLWLGNPPPGCSVLCLYILLNVAVNRLVSGFDVAIKASGKVAAFQSVNGACNLLVFLLTLIFLINGLNVHAIGLGLVLGYGLGCMFKAYFAQKIVGISYRDMVYRNVIPVFSSVFMTGAIAYLPHFLLPSSFLRVLLTSCLSVGVYIPLIWGIVLDETEKTFVLTKLRRFLHARNDI